MQSVHQEYTNAKLHTRPTTIYPTIASRWANRSAAFKWLSWCFPAPMNWTNGLAIVRCICFLRQTRHILLVVVPWQRHLMKTGRYRSNVPGEKQTFLDGGDGRAFIQNPGATMLWTWTSRKKKRKKEKATERKEIPYRIPLTDKVNGKAKKRLRNRFGCRREIKMWHYRLLLALRAWTAVEIRATNECVQGMCYQVVWVTADLTLWFCDSDEIGLSTLSMNTSDVHLIRP